MALTIPLESQLTSVAFASSFIAQLRSITLSDIGAREALETTSLDTAASTTISNMTFTPSVLSDAGTCTFEIAFNPDTTPPSNDAAETITITWPSTGQMTAGTWACEGFMTNMNITGSIRAHLLATVDCKFSGDWTITASA